MGICYLILCHNNSNQIKAIVDVLSGDDAYFLIHVDSKSKDDFSCLYEYINVKFVQDRVSICWGDISVIDAVLTLSDIALSIYSDVSHYVLISGADFPVKNHAYIKKQLQASPYKDHIMGLKIPSEESPWLGGGIRRLAAYVVPLNSHNSATIEPYSFTMENLRQFVKVLVVSPFKILKAFSCFVRHKRITPYGLSVFSGEMWWILSKDTLKRAICWNKDNPEFYKFMCESQIPDEMYFNTIIWNISCSVEPNIHRYISWRKKTDQSPYWMLIHNDKACIDRCLKDKDIYFVRKTNDPNIIEYVKSKL